MIKKLLTTSFAIAACFTANAQITLTSADLGSIGDQVQQAVDTLPASTLSPGSAGTNQTWNFSGLAQHIVETVTFSNPNWNANSQDFPNANLAVVDPSGGVAYMNNSATSATALGFSGDLTGSGNPISAHNNPPELLMNWPATYGSNFTQNFRTTATFYYGQDPGIGFTVDSVRYTQNVTKYDSIDAWGSITTPLSTYNVLRMEEFRRTYDTIDMYAFGFWQNAAYTIMDSTLTYSWWTNNMDFSIVQLNMDIANNTVTRATWTKANPTPSGMNDLSSNGTTLYPNPANNAVTININNSGAENISIYDIAGKKLSTIAVNSNMMKIDVSAMSAGVYFYAVTAQDGTVLHRSTFTVSK
jgi:hypothetical protein